MTDKSFLQHALKPCIPIPYNLSANNVSTKTPKIVNITNLSTDDDKYA